ncbi:MAG: hypothetical protein DWQ19_11475 [Crenarchaeota archaeon]|nr:MAG: hypothetical protein DWQ19_11475 [Thermoproteota archaeon]
MSEGLNIFSGGKLKELKFNPNRRDKFRYSRSDGKYFLKDLQTKEVLHTFYTARDLDLFLCDVLDVEFTWHLLRNEIRLEEGVTLGDIYKVINNYKELKKLIEFICPEYPNVRKFVESSDHSSEEMIITTKGEITNGVFEIKYDMGYIDNRNWCESTRVTIDNKFQIVEKGKVIDEVLYAPSFLELIIALFGVIHQEPCVFTKEGLKRNDNVIEGGLDLLFCPITLDEELTFADVLNYVKDNELLSKFIANYSWCNAIDIFHKQVNEVHPLDEKEKLWHLKIDRTCRFYKGIDKYLCVEPANFHAVGEISEQSKSLYQGEIPDYETYSVSMTPMWELAHLPFELDEDLIIRWLNKNYGIEKDLVCQFPYKLIDFLDSIYWDISFYGGPEESDKLKEELNEVIEEVKENLDSGNVEYLDLDSDDLFGDDDELS